MPGRKVVPIEINKKHFTLQEKGKRMQAEQRLKGGNNQVKPPKWLDETAKKEFRRLAKELILLDIITNTDVGGLAIACDAYSKYIIASAAITKSTIDAEITKSSNDATVKRHPLGAVEKYATIYRQYCSEYGLTPAARIKLSAQYKSEEDAEPTGVMAYLKQRAEER
jgi:P27 family predicted phage terminase small subunit